MALDPRISLAVQPPNIQPPDLLKTMLASAQLREASTLNASRMQQMQEMQAELVRQERQREMFRGWEEEDRRAAQWQVAAPAPSILRQELGLPSSATVPAARQPEFGPRSPAPTPAPGPAQAPAPTREATPPPAAAGQPTPAPLPSGAPQQGFLGPQDLGGGRTATVLNQTVTDERINGGKPTNIPLIVPGIPQAEIKAIADGKRPSKEAYERSVAHAQSRIAGGETIQSYNTIDEAVGAAKSESGERGQQLASTAQSPAAAVPTQPAQVTPLPGMRMTPRTATQRAYAILGNGASNALQVVQGIDAAENAEVNRQTARLSQAVAGLDYIQRASGGVNSQETLDAVRVDIESKAPGAGAILPRTYEPAQWTQFQNGLKTQEQLHREALLEIQKGNLKVAQGGLGVQQQQADIHQQQVATQERAEALKFAVQAAPIVHDQTSLDNFRKNLPERIAALLPQTYTAESWAKTLENLKQAHARAIGEVGAMQPTYYRDANGNLVAMQPTNLGNMRPFNVQGIPGQQAAQPVPQPGVPSTGTIPPVQGAGAQAAPQGPLTPAPPVKVTDTGTEIVPLGPGGVQQGPRIQKQPEETERLKAKGTEAGKYEGKLPETARKVETLINQLNQKQSLVSERIDKAIKQAENKDNWLPTTGVVGGAIKNFYQPGTDLANTLETVAGNTGVEELQAIRDSSPTGAALGPVSDYENRMLQSLRGSFQQGQSKEQLIENLTFLKKFMADAQKWRIETFQRDLAKGIHEPRIPQVPAGATVTPPASAPAVAPLPGQQPTTPQSPAGQQPPAATTGRRQIGEAEIQQIIRDSQQPGKVPKTRQQVIDAVRKNPAYELLVQ